MKNILLILLALTSFCRVDARDYLPVYTEGKVWNYSYYKMVDGEVQKAEYQRYVDKDTIIDGKNCKIILSRKMKDDYNIHYLEDKEVVYESDKKIYSVYYWVIGGPQFELRLDFNLESGDHFKIYDYYPIDFYVSSTDSVIGGDIKRKRIKLAFGDNWDCKGEDADCWIEGVGTTLTTWLENTLARPTCTKPEDMVIARFDSCYDGGVCIYKSDEQPPTLSDFTSAIVSVTADRLSDKKMYNLSGQQVGKDYKGIVIQGGKKFCK